MSDHQQVSEQASKSEKAENRRMVPQVFLAMVVVGIFAIGAVFTLGAKFVFH